MEKLVLDGKVFVKAASAAEDLGYTRDYIGQLCRGGKIDAHLVGRTWYVDQEQLRVHRKEKKRMSKVKAREQVRGAIQTALQGTEANTKAYESRITYEPDEGELMPAVKKLTVDTHNDAPKKTRTSKKASKERSERDSEPDYTIENEGSKVVMSGALEVTDASEEAGWFDDRATTLHARIVQNVPETHKDADKKSQPDKQNKDISGKQIKTDPVPVRSTDESTDGMTTFEKKLLSELNAGEAQDPSLTRSDAGHAAGSPAKDLNTSTHTTHKTRRRSASGKLLTYGLLIACVCVAGAATLLEGHWSVRVTGDEPTVVTDSYVLDAAEVRQYIKTKTGF